MQFEGKCKCGPRYGIGLFSRSGSFGPDPAVGHLGVIHDKLVYVIFVLIILNSAVLNISFVRERNLIFFFLSCIVNCCSSVGTHEVKV